VKTHLLRIFGKLGVSDRTAAVTTAIARGILPSGRDD
jgi:ATP/maltotriose-dependent transcriptional regulator MalT